MNILITLFAALEVLSSVSGFSRPESALWDAEARRWYVSNIAGSPSAKDGEGWISVLGEDGELIKMKWAAGLDAPKGMAIVGEDLWVANITELVAIDRQSGKIIRQVPVKDSVFLNDLAAGRDGSLYVSDTMTNTIHRLVPRGAEAEVFVRSPRLMNPNGLVIKGDKLAVASWGRISDPATWKTAEPGHIVLIDLKSREISDFGAGVAIGHLDGIAADGDGFLVTDHAAGSLLWVEQTGKPFLLESDLNNAADFGWDPEHHRTAIPEMNENRLKFLKVPGRQGGE